MAFAAVLDPRYKFQIVEWGFEKAYGDEYKSELAIVKDKLFSLFKEYVDESNLNKTKVGEPKNDSNEGSQDVVLDEASSSLLMVCYIIIHLLFSVYSFSIYLIIFICLLGL